MDFYLNFGKNKRDKIRDYIDELDEDFDYEFSDELVYNEEDEDLDPENKYGL